MRNLRSAAWTVFLLDLVILGQFVYAAFLADSDPLARTSSRGLASMLGSSLVGIAVVLVVSSWRRSKPGLWVALLWGVAPLLWTVGAIFQSLWE